MSATYAAIGIFAFQFTFMSMSLGFTSAASILRPAFLVIVILCPFIQLPYLEDIHYAPLRGAVGAACVYTVILYLDAVLLHKFTLDADGPTSSAGGLKPVKPNGPRNGLRQNGSLDNALTRLWFGLVISCQARFPGTKWPVKNIPPHSRSDPNYIPSATQFVLRTLPMVLVSFNLLVLVGYAPRSGDNTVTFSPEKVPLLLRFASVSRQELLTRVGSVLGYWTVQYFLHIAVHGLAGMLFVGSGISNANAWPPIFGSVRDAYSIRRFWGTFWHQLIRRGCSSIAYFITYTCLPFKKGSFIGRYLFISLVFSVSGIFHLFCDITQGVPLLESGAMRFFMLQALAIMFEDAVSAALRQLFRRKSKNFGSSLKPMGYFWVAAWLVWSSPTWIYSSMRRATGAPLIPVPSHVEAFFEHIYLEGLSWYHSQASGTYLSIVFKLLSGMLALTLFLVGNTAILQPLKLAHNTGLSLPEQPRGDKNGKVNGDGTKYREAQRRDILRSWVIMFGVRDMAIGLAVGIMLFLGEYRSAAIMLSVLWVVAAGDTCVMHAYGTKGWIKNGAVPGLLILWVGPAYLFWG